MLVFKSVLLVYNHKSGLKLGPKFINLIHKKLTRQFHQIETYEIKDWSGEIFEKFKNKNIDLVVALGGDGTLNTCAKLILDFLPNAGLKIIPAGSTNVLARSLNLPRSLIKNINSLDKIGEWQQIKIDVGVLNDNYYFLDAVIIGYLAKVINATGQKLKNLFGFGGYLINFLRHRKPQAENFTMTINDKKISTTASTIIIANTLNILGFTPRHKSDFTDGFLEVMFMAYNSFTKFLFSVWHFFFSTKKVTRLRGQKITIAPLDIFSHPIQIDGDPITKINPPYQITISPQALKIWR
ncbi:MAG TPA: diacylglycerol kinase family protein [bacterium]|mgnify:CR=1 FL=1|nr:diacylglycerol kinase family protein [bacterium]HPL95345.1 diacylglycerol kinase family protein [bacterium]